MCHAVTPISYRAGGYSSIAIGIFIYLNFAKKKQKNVALPQSVIYNSIALPGNAELVGLLRAVKFA